MAENQDTPTKVSAPAPVFTPAAAHIAARPRDKFIETIKGYKFAGNPRTELANEALDLALRLAETLPDADQLEARIEIGGATARQVHVIVYPHTY
jgi:hypothetical protein